MGKTELARAMAEADGRELIRLQCYEGLDEAKALYEWEYAKQLLYTQLLEGQDRGDPRRRTHAGGCGGAHHAQGDAVFFSQRFLLRRGRSCALCSATCPASC